MTSYTGGMPTFTAGVKTGNAARLNQLRDLGLAFTDAWAAYTPTLTAATTNPTGWTQTGYWMRAGKLVVAKFKITAGGSMTTGSGQYAIALPTAANVSGIADIEAGQVTLGNGSSAALALPQLQSTTLRLLYFPTATTGAFVGHNAPWAWASAGNIRGQIVYEAA